MKKAKIFSLILSILLLNLFLTGCYFSMDLSDISSNSPTAEHSITPPTSNLSFQMKNKDLFSYTSTASGSSTGVSIVKNNSGHYFSLGTSGVYGRVNCLVRKSVDDGSSWSVVDDYRNHDLESGILCTAKAIIVNPSASNEVYYIGSVMADSNGSGLESWFVRKSTDSGTTWMTVDIYTLDGTRPARALAAAIATDGTLFVVGYANKNVGGFDYSHWIVRRSIDLGTSWTTVRDYQLSAPNQNSEATAITISGSGEIFVGGYGQDSASHKKWLIQSSTDKGASWSNSKEYQLFQEYDAKVEGMYTASPDALYAVGYAEDSSLRYHWITMKFSAGLWTVVDDFLGSGAVRSSRATAVISVPTTSYVYVLGSNYDNTEGAFLWTIRYSVDGGNSWNLGPSYPTNTPGAYTTGYGVAHGPNTTTLISVGSATVNADLHEDAWVTRSIQLSSGVPSWNSLYLYRRQQKRLSSPSGLASHAQRSTLVAAGYGKDELNKNKWIVRQASTSNTSTWKNIDVFLPSGFVSAKAQSATMTGLQNIFVLGQAQRDEGGGGLESIAFLNFSNNDGISWSSLIDSTSTALKAGLTSRNFLQLIEGRNNHLWMLVEAEDTSLNQHWLIVKSTDNGVTWIVSDDYQKSVAENSIPKAIAYDPKTHNLYAIGLASSSFLDKWIVRRSTNDGTSWTTVDDFSLPTGNEAQANSLTIDPLGYLYVAGLAMDGNGFQRAIIRQSQDAGESWATIDNHSISASGDSHYTSITSDSKGNIYAGGITSTASSIGTWFLRRSTDSGLSWTNVTMNSKLGVSESTLTNPQSRLTSMVPCLGGQQICLGFEESEDILQWAPTWVIKIIEP